MKYISEPKPAAAQPHPNTNMMTNAMQRRSHPARRTEPSGFSRPQAKNSQNAQRNYERYLVLARAEALTGDRIAAENYFQHAEHFFRSMEENTNEERQAGSVRIEAHGSGPPSVAAGGARGETSDTVKANRRISG
jgi:hypothetical protein